jgi:hypothetical protein
MEGKPAEPPLKVCPHCSVASRTDAEMCPSCGKPYVRSRPSLGWWIAIPVVAAAFLIGYFGISQLIEDEPAGISQEEAGAVEAGISRPDLIERLGEDPTVERKRSGDQTCLYYQVTDESDAVWQFCFQGDKLVSSGPLPG